MKKVNFLLAASLALLVSCTQKDQLPENPKDKQEYRDSNGNSWIWNALLMRWALMPSTTSGVASSPAYFYYPGNNSWTNANGVKVEPPSTVNKSTYSSVKPNSSRSGSSYGKSGSKPSSGKGFGISVSRPSHSFGA